jgi:hypothetical protein
MNEGLPSIFAVTTLLFVIWITCKFYLNSEQHQGEQYRRYLKTQPVDTPTVKSGINIINEGDICKDSIVI